MVSALWSRLAFNADEIDLNNYELFLHSTDCNNCTVSTDDLKCMSDAGTKNGDKLKEPCNGVDLDTLKTGNVRS